VPFEHLFTSHRCPEYLALPLDPQPRRPRALQTAAMSFGYSIGDGILLVQLAWRTVQGARQACGEHDELTREVSSLHRVLQQLHRELSNPESLLNRADNKQREEMEELCEGCQQILNVMNAIVTKYNTLSDDERSGKRIWQKVKFGNGEMKDLAEIRLKMLAHTSALIMGLNLCSLGSQGKVEKQLEGVGGDLEGIRAKVDWIVANITAKSEDGTVWTSYTNDDKTFWRELRRELVKEGYHSSVLRKHKWLLKSYVEELGMRGVFDNLVDEEVLAESADEGEESNILIQDVHSTSAADLEDADSDDPDSGNADLEDKSSKDSPSEEVQAEEASSECASTGNLESRDSSDNETVRPYLETKNYTKSTSHAAKQEQPPQATSQKNSSCAVAAMPAQVEKLPDKESAPSSHSNDLDSKLDERGIQKAELNRGSPPLHTASAKASQPPNYFRKVPVSIPQKPQYDFLIPLYIRDTRANYT
jgi:hypothetical protein